MIAKFPIVDSGSEIAYDGRLLEQHYVHGLQRRNDLHAGMDKIVLQTGPAANGVDA